MSDFAWATVHGFITLVLDGQIGESESSRALKARSLATLAAMVETVVRTGGGRIKAGTATVSGARHRALGLQRREWRS